MRRQPRILAGTALGLLMASAPLGAAPLQSTSADAAHVQALPLILAQANCAEGESADDCAAKQAPAGPEEKPRKKREKQAEPAPAEAAPAAEPERKAAPAEEAAPAEAEQKSRKKREKQAEPAPAQESAPAAEPELKAAPAQEAAPAEQAAPAEPEQKPRKKRGKQAEPAPETAPAVEPEQKAAPAVEPEQNAAPAEEAAPAEPEQKPRKKREKQAEPAEQNAPKPEPKPAQAEQAPAESGQSSGQAAEPGSQKEKLRNYLKKKQQGETPAEAQPEEQATPTENNAPKPEPKPAQAEQAPAQGEQPAEQAGQPKSEKEKLRDYLKKKKQGGGEASPQETQQPAGEAKQPAEQAAPQTGEPQENRKAGEETAPAGKQAEGQAGQATQPELPSNTREQAMPKPREKARPQPENAAPLPDSAKQGGPAAAEPEGQAAGANDQQSRKQQQQAEQAGANPEAVPQSDSAAQTDIGRIGKIESVEAVQGKRLDRKQWLQDQRKWREGKQDQNGGQVVNEINNRYIVKYGDNIYVDNRGSNRRLERNARDSYVEALPDNFSRYTIVKDNGIRIVTIRNSYGDIVRRSRILPDNHEVILYYVPESDYGDIRRGYYDAGADLPPLRLDIPADEYILDAQYAEPDDYYTYLDAPPVEPVERIYSVDEVVHSARIRDKVRRIDLDTITFDTGSFEIGEDQVNHLQALGDAINKILKQNPAETFLIEGHTDAVGSDESNLVLSDERAQSVAEALTSVFDIPAENLTTQGYGERYLKVNTQGADRENRRVAIRRITPLVAPVASAE